MEIMAYCRTGTPRFPPFVALIIWATIIGLLVWSIVRGGTVGFTVKVVLMTLVLSIVPSVLNIVGEYWGKFLEAVVQAISATGIVAAFSLWLVGRSSLGKWLLFLLLLLIVILIGNYVVLLIQEKVIKRLTRAKEFKFSEWEIERLKQSAKYQVLFYASLPIGITISLIYGLTVGLSQERMLALFIPVILGVASLILVATLLVSAAIMSKSLILMDLDAAKPRVEEQNESLLNSVAGYFKVRVPTQKKVDDVSSKNLDMAYLVVDVRKVYFYDAVHCVILLFGFSVAILSTINLQFITSHLIWVGVGGLLLLFVFCYLPYSVGQYQLHEVILEHSSLEGLKRKKLKEALMKNCSLYPQSDFIGALAASGTVGGILCALAYELMKNALK